MARVLVLLLGACMGSGFTILFFLSEPGIFAWWLNSVLSQLLTLVAGVFVGLIIIGLLFWRWLKRTFLKASGTAEDIIGEIEATFKSVITLRSEGTIRHAVAALRTAFTWYSDITWRQFMVRTTLSTIVMFGGVAGAGLLFRQTLLLGQQTLLLGKQNDKLDEQTSLLRDQNAKLDQQTVTADAQRRSAFSTEMFALLQASADRERDQPPSSGLIARAVTLTRAATPFYYVKVDWDLLTFRTIPKLIETPLSPERGQLLVGLTSSKFDVPALVRAGATFRGADLRTADLSTADLSGADLSGADLSITNLRDAILHRADLRGADLRQADLRGANLNSANLGAANLTGAQLDDTVSLDGAIVSFYHPDERRRLGGFPEGWVGQPPKGWELSEEDNTLRLRRIRAVPPTPSLPSP